MTSAGGSAVDRPSGGNGVWSAFTKGNTAAVKSGAYSPRVRNAWAQALFDWATTMGAKGLQFLADDSFAPSVWRWSDRTAHADLLYQHLMDHHAAAGDTPCRGCAVCVSLEERWQRADRTAERAGESLGLDPASRADLLMRLRAAGVINTAEDDTKTMLERLGAALGLDDGSAVIEDAELASDGDADA